MEKIFQIDLAEKDKPTFKPYKEISASDYNIYEKDIENWFSKNRDVLFSDKDAILIFYQETSGERQADILGIDSQGNLIIIELKRSWADRTTIGQVLDYAATISKWSYENFNDKFKEYKGADKELIKEFRAFVDNEEFQEDDLCKTQRLFVVAPHFEENLIKVIRWLKKYQLPIDIIPFALYEQKGQLIIKVKQIEVEPLSFGGIWKGDWFFNTNETYAPGAYKKMLKNNCIAIYGYDNPKEILSGPNTGDRVYYYRNGMGIIAVAEIDDDIKSTDIIFNQKTNNEYIRMVKNLISLSDGESGISSAEVKRMGYNLPVRSTLCKIYNAKVAEMLHREIKDKVS